MSSLATDASSIHAIEAIVAPVDTIVFAIPVSFASSKLFFSWVFWKRKDFHYKYFCSGRLKQKMHSTYYSCSDIFHWSNSNFWILAQHNSFCISCQYYKFCILLLPLRLIVSKTLRIFCIDLYILKYSERVHWTYHSSIGIFHRNNSILWIHGQGNSFCSSCDLNKFWALPPLQLVAWKPKPWTIRELLC